jgi:hypothetical protein
MYINSETTETQRNDLGTSWSKKSGARFHYDEDPEEVTQHRLTTISIDNVHRESSAYDPRMPPLTHFQKETLGDSTLRSMGTYRGHYKSKLFERPQSPKQYFGSDPYVGCGNPHKLHDSFLGNLLEQSELPGPGTYEVRPDTAPNTSSAHQHMHMHTYQRLPHMDQMDLGHDQSMSSTSMISFGTRASTAGTGFAGSNKYGVRRRVKRDLPSSFFRSESVKVAEVAKRGPGPAYYQPKPTYTMKPNIQNLDGKWVV